MGLFVGKPVILPFNFLLHAPWLLSLAHSAFLILYHLLALRPVCTANGTVAFQDWPSWARMFRKEARSRTPSGGNKGLYVTLWCCHGIRCTNPKLLSNTQVCGTLFLWPSFPTPYLWRPKPKRIGDIDFWTSGCELKHERFVVDPVDMDFDFQCHA